MERIKQYSLPLVIIVVSLFAFFGRQIFSSDATESHLLEGDQTEVEWEALLETEESESEEFIEPEADKSPLLVDVKGAVVSPGVYELSDGERIDNAIQKAGGLTEKADVNAVNFALHVTDEMMIIVPFQGEEGVELSLNLEAVEQNAEQLININTAEVTDLLTLSGIGPQKALSIIEYREANGFFKDIDELTEVSGIGIKTLEKIQDQITVN